MKKDNFFSKSHKKELEKLISEITQEAKNVVEDYTKNPSDASGEVDVKRGMVKGDGIEIDLDRWEDEDK